MTALLENINVLKYIMYTYNEDPIVNDSILAFSHVMNVVLFCTIGVL